MTIICNRIISEFQLILHFNEIRFITQKKKKKNIVIVIANNRNCLWLLRPILALYRKIKKKFYTFAKNSMGRYSYFFLYKKILSRLFFYRDKF